MNMAQYGRIEIHLADLLEKSGLSDYSRDL